MELSRKTTILLSPELHDRLTRLAEQEQTSLGELVRRACEAQYGVTSEEDRLDAVKAIGDLRLPVGTVEAMNREATPTPEDLLP